MHPTDKPLVWREERDLHGNSTHEALSITYGNAQGEPIYYWRAQCVLLDNEAKWDVSPSGLPLEAFEGTSMDASIYDAAEAAMDACQQWENEIRNRLGADIALAPEPEPEAPPVIIAEDGFAPTTSVKARWSRNEGMLRFVRIWRRPDTTVEQEREITDPEEERACLKAYFTARMIEDLVTRLVTGGFGRLILDTPFATVVMQAELDFLHVSSMSATIRRPGCAVEHLDIPAPTTERIMQVIARQMHERKRQLENKAADADTHELLRSIARSAKSLGIDYLPPIASMSGGGGVLPVTLEDIQAGGGDIANPGQKNSQKTR